MSQGVVGSAFSMSFSYSEPNFELNDGSHDGFGPNMLKKPSISNFDPEFGAVSVKSPNPHMANGNLHFITFRMVYCILKSVKGLRRR